MRAAPAAILFLCLAALPGVSALPSPLGSDGTALGSIAAGLQGPLFPATSDGTSQSRSYAGNEGLDLACILDDGAALVRASARDCFTVSPGDTSVEVVLDDATALAVPATAVFFTESGAWAGPDVAFCGTATLAIPAGTVAVDILAGYSADTLLCGTAATTGRITATFA